MQVDSASKTALMAAAMFGHENIVSVDDVISCCDEIWSWKYFAVVSISLLHLFHIFGALQVTLLLDCDADVNAVDHLGWHAGHYAVHHGHSNIAFRLVDASKLDVQ